MASDILYEFANHGRGLVIAPAGCGKTHLIAASTAMSRGRQLILTHTHAGVRALINHLKRQGIPSAQYRVSTIDGFALRYASSFGIASGWKMPQPTGDDWKALRPACCRALEHRSVQKVIQNSYSGVFVDEYQDCTSGQHNLVRLLNNIVPVRAVGDPMQAIFRTLDPSDHCEWAEVTSLFELIGELSTPHRWNGRNDELGLWLLDVRRRLANGTPIDLRNAPITWERVQDDQRQLSVCFNLTRHSGHTSVALRKWRTQCHSLARNLKGTFRAMETVECKDLLDWAVKLETAIGQKRVSLALEFADLCIAGLPQAVKKYGKQLQTGRPLRPRRPDFARVATAISQVIESNELLRIMSLMDAIEAIDDALVYARDELWREMHRSLREHSGSPAQSLKETAWHIRNRTRYTGRNVASRSLSTTLLVKGLEFDHAAVLDVADHATAEELYVALTRGARSLTVISASPILKRPRPHFVVAAAGR